MAAIAAEQQKAVSAPSGTPGMFTAFPATATARESQAAQFEASIESTRQQQQRVRTAVAPYLSAAQLEQFEQLQANQLEMRQISAKMRRAQSAAEARGDMPAIN